MPVYQFQCEKCGDKEIYMSVKDYNPDQICDCGQPLDRVWTGQQVNVKNVDHELIKLKKTNPDIERWEPGIVAKKKKADYSLTKDDIAYINHLDNQRK